MRSITCEESARSAPKKPAEIIWRSTRETLITLLAGGHALLIGVPGLAKTRLVETLGSVLGLAEKRVQFTPDLMPADILGSEVLEESDAGRRAGDEGCSARQGCGSAHRRPGGGSGIGGLG